MSQIVPLALLNKDSFGWYITKLKKNKKTNQAIAVGIKRVHTFPKSINPKVNVRAWLQFELAHYDFAIQHISHYEEFAMTTVLLQEWQWN